MESEKMRSLLLTFAENLNFSETQVEKYYHNLLEVVIVFRCDFRHF
ncbi:hypothetical protein GXM_01472 [Nostoc sphaeroides CCNUC1]|uniref:Uncharacterized protein n=1 Tax=Nostoc sphaeroides CCNUC1 TaxID=2653204 RepID=A0A5P8VVR0_9NOSO|nr:hypothetical protein GXM_01472 [Nostoc sphaeroides CCNUC1]